MGVMMDESNLVASEYSLSVRVGGRVASSGVSRLAFRLSVHTPDVSGSESRRCLKAAASWAKGVF